MRTASVAGQSLRQPFRSNVTTGQSIQSCCVAGMHRSGTSMVAQLLHACGVSLGPPEELSKSSRYNTRGYFENLSFVAINNQLLRHLNGQWDAPPEFPRGWEFTPEADALMPEARSLVRRFARSHWGWKDPRNSLTLPFWRRVVPDLKLIVCVRNPLEVAGSLFLRSHCGNRSELQLWNAYYQQVLAATDSKDRLVTHYQSYFEDPQTELRRLVDWLELDVSDEIIARACAQVSRDMRHHEISGQELLDGSVPDDVLGAYFTMCAEAGPVYEQIRAQTPTSSAEAKDGLMKEVAALQNELLTLRTLHEEIVNSTLFKFISWWWKMPRLRRPTKVAVNPALIVATTWHEQA